MRRFNYLNLGAFAVTQPLIWLTDHPLIALALHAVFCLGLAGGTWAARR